MFLKSRKSAVIILIISLATILAYWKILDHGFSMYDDDVYVTDNKHITSGLTIENFVWAFTSGDAANWHPLTWIALMTECQFFGLAAKYYHLVSLTLHLANGVLVFLV